MENNICKYLALAPNDAHYYKDCEWSYESEILYITTFDSGQGVRQRYRILVLTNKLLKFVQIK
ncbi:MAG: hypothetical protein GY936_00995 [Ignavibacteriae bacterium]|nr:hypothetical protein [Ignavibacteriota bacterium]